MNLIRMMDAILRDRETLYRQAAEGRDLKKLCARLLAVFVLTAALYGASMGSFRLVHPEYFFSNYELTGAGQAPVQGRVAGMNAATRRVYVKEAALPALKDATVRFNLLRPSERYRVESVGMEQDYGVLVLAQGPPLSEAGAWRLSGWVAMKLPLLFVLTLVVCSLALYVLNLAFNIGLRFMPTMTLMSFGLAATGIMLGVFIPIVAMFSAVTENYHFVKVMHLAVFTIAGLFGVKVLYGGLVRLAPAGARGTRPLLMSWILLYCLVGGQLAWTLKPFLGTPYLPTTPPFRVEAGNIYVSFFKSLSKMGD